MSRYKKKKITNKLPYFVALTWEMLKDENLNPSEKILLIKVFDKIFGLDLDKVQAVIKDFEIPSEIIEIAEKRKEAKKNKDFKLADELRNQIKEKGFEVVDEKYGAYNLKPLH